MSDIESILTHLKVHGNAINAFTAFEKFDVADIHSQIKRLRKQGHEIERTFVSERGKRVANYRLR